MMKLTVTLTDNGKPREAIPVRAVPLVTDWFVSADSLAIALAGDDGVFRFRHTAHIQTDAEPKAIPQADWCLIATQLQALCASLPVGAPGQYEWRHRSISELPSAAFLWADEFSDAYRESFNNAIHLELSEGETLHPNGEVRIPIAVSDQLQRIALEGFQDMPLGIVKIPEETPSAQIVDADFSPGPKEYGPSRDEWIFKRVKKLRASRTKAFLRTVAAEMDCSVSAIKQAIARHHKKNIDASSNTNGVQSSTFEMLQAAAKHKK
jgi:hypothetical protein